MERLKKVFDEVFGTFSEDLSVTNLDKWDSVAHLTLLVALEEEFSVVIDTEAADLLDVQTIAEFLRSKGIENL